MQLRLFNCLLAICVLGTAACSNSSIGKITHVEVWNGSPHDVFTSNLIIAVEDHIKQAPSLALSSGKRSGSLLVSIPSAVKWKKVSAKIEITYSVIFSTYTGMQLGSDTGSCSTISYDECAKQIVRKALVAASKME